MRVSAIPTLVCETIMKIGILPLARATFDVPFAEEKLTELLAVLDGCGHEIAGPRTLLFDADETRAAINGLKGQNIDQLLLLQITFTDALMTVEAANAFDMPLSIWAVPEPRLGRRLRLNAFCGLNLASHALGLSARKFSWAYGNADDVDLNALLSGEMSVEPITVQDSNEYVSQTGETIANAVNGKRVARIGERPVGFDTCDYSRAELRELAGVEIDELELSDLFSAAKAAPQDKTAEVMSLAKTSLDGLDSVDQSELDRSLRLKVALDEIKAGGGYDAFAIRCWPETFTEYGGAVCGPVSMLGEARVPCACEADVYGAVTQLILQEVAQAPVFLADLVDMDLQDDTGVVWHCGQAPLSMRDESVPAEATIHTNRKMPLLYEFPLKPGRVTFFRLSRAHGQPKIIIATGQMLQRPMAFTGTSGVVRFDKPATDVLAGLMNSGLEHHMALAYGDHKDTLCSVAAAMGLPIVVL